MGQIDDQPQITQEKIDGGYLNNHTTSASIGWFALLVQRDALKEHHYRTVNGRFRLWGIQ